MARSRNIKPSIMANEELAELEPLSRLLFIYLWMLADKAGRLEDRPKRIAAHEKQVAAKRAQKLARQPMSSFNTAIATPDDSRRTNAIKGR